MKWLSIDFIKQLLFGTASCVTAVVEPVDVLILQFFGTELFVIISEFFHELCEKPCAGTVNFGFHFFSQKLNFISNEDFPSSFFPKAMEFVILS